MIQKTYDISSGILPIARYHYVLMISTFASPILSFARVAVNGEAKTFEDLTLCCVFTLQSSSVHNSLAISLFTSTIVHIDFLEVQKKSISSDMRLRAFVLLVAETDTLCADPHYSAQRREDSN